MSHEVGIMYKTNAHRSSKTVASPVVSSKSGWSLLLEEKVNYILQFSIFTP